jgi:RNA polymerase-binding transcription factor DksA
MPRAVKKAAPANKRALPASRSAAAPAKKKAAPALKRAPQAARSNAGPLKPKAAPAAAKKAAPTKKKAAPAPVKKAVAKKAAPTNAKKAAPAAAPAPAPARAAAPAPKKAAAPTAPPKKAPVKTGPVVLDKFQEGQKAALLIERASYLQQADSLKAEADLLVAEREPGDVQFDEESGEGDTLAVERERDLALSAQARQAVDEIDAALAKLANGTYGICEQCGGSIPKERLRAIPFAALCVQCKSMGLGRR